LALTRTLFPYTPLFRSVTMSKSSIASRPMARMIGNPVTQVNSLRLRALRLVLAPPGSNMSTLAGGSCSASRCPSLIALPETSDDGLRSHVEDQRDGEQSGCDRVERARSQRAGRLIASGGLYDERSHGSDGLAGVEGEQRPLTSCQRHDHRLADSA